MELELNGLTLVVPEGLRATPQPPTGLHDWRKGGLAPFDGFAAALEDTHVRLTPLPEMVETAAHQALEDARITAHDDTPGAILEERDGVLSWHILPQSRQLDIKRGFQRWRGWAVWLEHPPELARLSAQVRVLESAPTLRQVRRPGECVRGELNEAWPVLESAEQIEGLPTDTTPRLLLWVHGTFTDTIGSFGDLVRCQPGRRVVRQMLDRYDAVIAFDHPTLSVRPGINAEQLLELLKQRDWPHGLHLELMSTSRGALVVRSLVERKAVKQTELALSFGKVFMVSPASGGTLLADPTQWRSWLDHSTNLIRAATDSGQRRFQAATGAITISRHRLQGALRLLQALAWGAHRPGHLPGLASMKPRSPFLSWLNASPFGRPPAKVEGYWWVLADFARDAPSLVPPESVSTLLRVLDRYTDRLFAGRGNDLVVDHEHALKGHKQLASRWKGALDFPTNSDVHHLNYLTFSQTRNAIAEVFGLGPVAAKPIEAMDRLADRQLDLILFRDRMLLALASEPPETDSASSPKIGALWQDDLLKGYAREAIRLGRFEADPNKANTDTTEPPPSDLPDPYAVGVEVGGIPYRDLFDASLDAIFAPQVDDTERRNHAVDAFYGRGAHKWLARLHEPDATATSLPTIVLLPGLPGSHLTDEDTDRRVWLRLAQFVRGNIAEAARLAPNGLDPAPGAASLVPDGVLRWTYGYAIAEWRKLGHAVVPFPFDWRKPLTSAADALDKRLEELSSQGHSSIVLVCHSTGGVVASLWAARHGHHLKRVQRAVFVGVPLSGTFQALELLTGSSGLLGLISAASLRDSHAEITQMAASWYGPVDMLPDPTVFEGPNCLATESWAELVRPTNSALAHGTAVLDDIADSPLLSRTHAIVGNNRNTVVRARLNPLRPDMRHNMLGPGDNTIPLQSALHPELASVHVANGRGHPGMLKDDKVIAAASQLACTGTSTELEATEQSEVWAQTTRHRRLPRPTHDLEVVLMKLLLGAASGDELLEMMYGVMKEPI